MNGALRAHKMREGYDYMFVQGINFCKVRAWRYCGGIFKEPHSLLISDEVVHNEGIVCSIGGNLN
jgi:hypothetical protein